MQCIFFVVVLITEFAIKSYSFITNAKQTFMRLKICAFFAIIFCVQLNAQNLDITGTVIDKESSIPIPGVNILIKNTAQGEISDFDGNFTIKDVPNGSILVFSYVGYLSYEVAVNSNEVLNVQLVPDIAMLDEVVVIGYGTQRKKEITGAVSIVSEETIEKLNPTRIEQALQDKGKLQVLTSSLIPVHQVPLQLLVLGVSQQMEIVDL